MAVSGLFCSGQGREAGLMDGGPASVFRPFGLASFVEIQSSWRLFTRD